MLLSSIVPAIIFGVVILGLAFMFFNKEKEKKTIDAREPISLSETYNVFFKSDGIKKDDFLEAWKFIATVYSVDPEKLRPVDQFDGVLRKLDAMTLDEAKNELLEYLESKQNSNSYSFKINSIRDFIIVCCKQIDN